MKGWGFSANMTQVIFNTVSGKTPRIKGVNQFVTSSKDAEGGQIFQGPYCTLCWAPTVEVCLAGSTPALDWKEVSGLKRRKVKEVWEWDHHKQHILFLSLFSSSSPYVVLFFFLFKLKKKKRQIVFKFSKAYTSLKENWGGIWLSTASTVKLLVELCLPLGRMCVCSGKGLGQPVWQAVVGLGGGGWELRVALFTIPFWSIVVVNCQVMFNSLWPHGYSFAVNTVLHHLGFAFNSMSIESAMPSTVYPLSPFSPANLSQHQALFCESATCIR